MFDIAWTELLLVAVVAILVVGPKELPGMLRTIGRTIGSVRRMAGEFQSSLNDAVKEAEKQTGIDEMRKQADAAQNFNPLDDLKKTLADEKKKLQDSMKTAESDVKSSLNGEGSSESKPDSAPEAAPVKAEVPTQKVVSSAELASTQKAKESAASTPSSKDES
ncbi:Sec-independent protein translocase protein TatB [Pseudovibrio sp. W64]|uniref:Sec-independent protein translocase protein TatB n=1 Tax=unclassified Pseudovibrio TaxID=2627060 RepID=UPI00070D9CFA|nr:MULTISPECIES: Sec-independent protein translocase protein TatB [unclassified Pseudovibrio]KZK80295.1 Sec-independent protein translocase protein TatB [Pseudovibrio sp. W64]KZK82524.1 Sec-independent protein translocase protein TatB [Pseudovibrio sp. Ad46]KZK83208.1 Sec-independent protein translocase protein TatB [Pseudovibrio sp. Ad13]KZK98520.1 Sec-independent protein translocase protein TatB [Pseudovibrio sp. W74]KZL01780.1 Sec-independent protein translocase protein TatB [Pseudovibrio s